MQPVRPVPCPRCGKLTEYSPDNKWRPFCSERCRMIDLGKWAAEDYRVPADGKEEVARPEPFPDADLVEYLRQAN